MKGKNEFKLNQKKGSRGDAEGEEEGGLTRRRGGAEGEGKGSV